VKGFDIALLCLRSFPRQQKPT